MADSGFNWDAAWTAIDAAITLTVGGTIIDNSATIDLDGKAACLINIDTDYSNHAKATGGLFVYIVKEVGDGNFEVEADVPWGFEMPFTQNGTNRVVFALSAAEFNKFQIHLDWDNTTASGVATTKTDIKYATIPPAA